MKASEIRALSEEEAEEKLTALKKELAKERAIIASGTRPEKPSKIRNLKRDIARILTVMAEKKIANQPKQSKTKGVKK